MILYRKFKDRIERNSFAGTKGYVGPPSQIIGGGGAAPPPPSSYAYVTSEGSSLVSIHRLYLGVFSNTVVVFSNMLMSQCLNKAYFPMIFYYIEPQHNEFIIGVFMESRWY